MTPTLKTSYGFEVSSPFGYDETVSQVKDAFKQQGFGTLTEIDVQRTLEEKLGEKMRRYIILGMCNPSLAHQAIRAEPSIGVLLPCNVVVREENDGSVSIAVQDPAAMMNAVGNPALEPVGLEASKRIHQAMASIR